MWTIICTIILLINNKNCVCVCVCIHCVWFFSFFLRLLQNIQVVKLSTLAWVKWCISFVKDTENQLVSPLMKILCTVSNMIQTNCVKHCCGLFLLSCPSLPHSYSGFTSWNVLRCLVACSRRCGQSNKGKGISWFFFFIYFFNTVEFSLWSQICLKTNVCKFLCLNNLPKSKSKNKCNDYSCWSELSPGSDSSSQPCCLFLEGHRGTVLAAVALSHPLCSPRTRYSRKSKLTACPMLFVWNVTRMGSWASKAKARIHLTK